ncbi:hypothetical protein MMC07_001522 [Pseudocyphellaria aurata]|nr:hypothetical protein [Pseudocyphellaria aurata]
MADNSAEVNTLDVIPELTYAYTLINTWQIIKFFLDDLDSVDTGALKPDECICTICSEELTDTHRAVRLPCGHIFGASCIKRWLSPFVPYNAERLFGPAVGANTCPMCRREFFPSQQYADVLPALEERIKLWDKAYAEVGIELPKTERRAREDVLRYLHSYSSTSGFDQYYLADHGEQLNRDYSLSSCRCLFDFARQARHENITPRQELLRRHLEEVARRLLIEALG